MSQAYQQVEIDLESQKLTTISTHKGLFQYRRLSYGIASAPGLFQREMEKICQELDGVLVFFDDLLVWGDSVSEHNNRLKNLCIKLRNAGLKLKREKCSILTNEIEFLGYKINANGILPSEKKINAIDKLAKPTNVKELQIFIGMINYYSKFIKNYADIMEPLYALLRKDNCWDWSQKCNQAFNLAKQKLMSSEILVQYDTNLPLKITCDASPNGVGAVLSHTFKDNTDRVIAYASRALSKAEKNYSQLDREALAIVFAVKIFHQYVYGRCFILETDHKPLTYIFGGKKGLPQMASSRVQRWGVFLSGYNFDIKHIKGKDNCMADGLSRLSSNVNNVDKSKRDDNLENEYTYLNHVTSGTKTIDINIILEETEKDPVLKLVRNFLKRGWPKELDNAFTPYKRRDRELVLENNVIMWGHRMVIPKTLRKDLLDELHVAHMGTIKMKALARSYFWWPNLDLEIEKITKSCELCIKHSNNPCRTPLKKWEWPTGPNHRLHIDFCGPIQNYMYLIITDAHSKWIDIKEMTTITTESTINVLREYFASWGLPK